MAAGAVSSEARKALRSLAEAASAPAVDTPESTKTVRELMSKSYAAIIISETGEIVVTATDCISRINQLNVVELQEMARQTLPEMTLALL